MRIRIFDFHPAFASAGSIGEIAPLRTFQSHFAGVLKDGLAILVEVLREPHPLSSPREKLFQFFALFKGMVAVILTIQFEQVERIQENLRVMGCAFR